MDPSTFDHSGRAKSFHQSPYDLDIVLLTGCSFQCGVTVNDTAADLLSVWWSPFSSYGEEDSARVRVIFAVLVEFPLGAASDAASHLLPRQVLGGAQPASSAGGASASSVGAEGGAGSTKCASAAAAGALGRRGTATASETEPAEPGG